jgi:hypothetical protein
MEAPLPNNWAGLTVQKSDSTSGCSFEGPDNRRQGTPSGTSGHVWDFILYDNQPMNVVWHHHMRVQSDVPPPFRGPPPLFFYNNPFVR